MGIPIPWDWTYKALAFSSLRCRITKPTPSSRMAKNSGGVLCMGWFWQWNICCNLAFSAFNYALQQPVFLMQCSYGWCNGGGKIITVDGTLVLLWCRNSAMSVVHIVVWFSFMHDNWNAKMSDNVKLSHSFIVATLSHMVLLIFIIIAPCYIYLTN